MDDHDELLAAKTMLERWEQGYELHADELIHTIEGLYVALRAGSATQPQLVQVGWFADPEQAAISLKYHQSFPAESPFPDGVPIFVRQSDLAPAGSATPTEMLNDPEGEEDEGG